MVVVLSGFLVYYFFLKPPDYQVEQIHLKLDKDAYKRLADIRERALEKGYLEREEDDYVPVEMLYRSQVLKGETRLKGDWLDHLEENKWSFRIKLDHPLEDGMKTFSVQNPECRGQLKAYVFYQLMRENGIVCNEFRVVELLVNGESWGVYFLEEHLTSRMIASSNRPPGVLIKFRDQAFFKATIEKKSTKGLIAESSIKMYGDLKQSDIYENELSAAEEIMKAYQTQAPDVYEQFDPLVMGKFYALCDLTGAFHAMGWINMRFYFNFQTHKMEPVAYDPYPILEWGNPYLGANYKSYENDSLDTKSIVYAGLKNDSICLYYDYYLDSYLENQLVEKFLDKHAAELKFLETELQKEHGSYDFDRAFFLNHVEAIRVARS